MSKVEQALAWALAVAGDERHGYDQRSRWGPDYDCSSFVISAWEQAGVPVREAGASYTGNMRVFLRCGFRDVTAETERTTGAGLRRGDVLLNVQHHTALYLGDGRLVQAAINEKGGITGGESGDQTGREISVVSYWNYPWDFVYRYEEAEADGGTEPEGGLPQLGRGSRGEAVRALQSLLLFRGGSLPRYGADADFGEETEAAVRAFQRRRGLDEDGIAGPDTWRELLR